MKPKSEVVQKAVAKPGSEFGLEQFGFEGKAVRMVMDGDMPWFSAGDVCKALGHTNTSKALIDHVDEEDRNTLTIRYGIRGNPNKAFVNESGLYALIFGSKKPAAKRFKRWVTSEVLPSIRKSGQYAAPRRTMVEDKTLKRGDFELTPALFTRLYYALGKRLGATVLVWYLLERGAINVWIPGTVRGIANAVGNAVKYTCINKFAYVLADEGVIGFEVARRGHPSRFMVFGAVVKKLLLAVPEGESELRPGLEVIGTKLVTVH